MCTVDTTKYEMPDLGVSFVYSLIHSVVNAMNKHAATTISKSALVLTLTFILDILIVFFEEV